MPKVHFVNEGRTIEARVGHNLWRLAVESDVQLFGRFSRFVNCRGRGLCGSCRVRIEADPSATNERWTWEELRLKEVDHRFACQCEVRGDLEVTTRPR